MHVLGTSRITGETIHITDDDRRRHIYAIGQTGSGKTNFIQGLALRDIQEGRGLTFIDKHGDAAKFLTDAAERPVLYWKPADLSHILGLNPLQNVPRDERWRIVARIVGALSEIWDLGPHTPNLLDNLRAAVSLLLAVPGSTLLQVEDVFTDFSYRTFLLSRTTDTHDRSVRKFWRAFDSLDKRQRDQQTASLLNKVRTFGYALPLRFILGQTSSQIDIQSVMDSGKVLLVDLSDMEDEPAAILGALLVSQYAQAAERRSSTPEERRVDHCLYIDEFQNFASRSFPKILSEARKWRLSLCLSHQLLAQVPDDIRSAIIGNCGTIVSFRIGAEDTRLIAEAIDTHPDHLRDLGIGEAWVCYSRFGGPSRAVPIKTRYTKARGGNFQANVLHTRSQSRTRKRAQEDLDRLRA